MMIIKSFLIIIDFCLMYFKCGWFTFLKLPGGRSATPGCRTSSYRKKKKSSSLIR